MARLDNPLRIPEALRHEVEVIRDMLRIGPLEPELCRRELLQSNPLAWMISVNGFLVNARTLPAEMQEEARRRGLIPGLPTPRAKDETSK